MVFKNFRFQIIFRVVLLTLCITILAWCVVQELYLRSFYLVAATLILIAELIWYIDRFNRDIKTFMQSITHRDFTLYFPAEGKGKSYNELYDTLNTITKAFKEISSEKEVQHRYLEMLVDHVRVGILSYDANEKIYLVNNALKRLLHKNILPNLKALESVDAALLHTLRDIRAGETRLLKLNINNELLQLSIHASEFRLDDAYYKLISMQNIRNELDAREMEAWQKLIRVLTHEIMNSVSPISSLSGTLHTMVQQERDVLLSSNPVLFDTLEKGLNAIKVRSEGLHGFTTAYRKLTQVPQPVFKKVNVKDILERIYSLFAPELNEKNIRFEVSSSSAEVVIDADLIEQVLINLVSNARDAVALQGNGFIQIKAFPAMDRKVSIHITDNGPGMDHSTLEKIFIPFFTTKKNGSGIGLALAKQILQLHNGEIKVESQIGKGSEFILLL